MTPTREERPFNDLDRLQIAQWNTVKLLQLLISRTDLMIGMLVLAITLLVLNVMALAVLLTQRGL